MVSYSTINRKELMKQLRRSVITILFLLPTVVFSQKEPPKVDWEVVARIREEGLQHSQVVDIVGYLSDVLEFETVPLRAHQEGANLGKG